MHFSEVRDGLTGRLKQLVVACFVSEEVWLEQGGIKGLNSKDWRGIVRGGQ